MTGSSSDNGSGVRSDSDVAFFGKITASVTHELNNVISIVDQNAGLLDDLIAGEQRGVPLSLERLESVSAAIQKQTQRGLMIIERLNRFAHSTDFDQTECDINETIGNLVELTRRLASLRRIELDYHSAPVALSVTGSPLVLQRAVFAVMGLAIDAGVVGSVIDIQNGIEDDFATIAILFESERHLGDEQAAESRSVVEKLGGRLGIEGDNGRTRLVMWLPKRLTT